MFKKFQSEIRTHSDRPPSISNRIGSARKELLQAQNDAYEEEEELFYGAEIAD